MNFNVWNAVEIFVAEVMASAFFMFFGCMSIMQGFTQRPPTILEAGMAFAFIISCIIVVRIVELISKLVSDCVGARNKAYPKK